MLVSAAAWLVVSGVSLNNSVALIALVFLQSWLGTQVIRLIFGPQESLITLLALGFAVGAAIVTITDQILVNSFSTSSRTLAFLHVGILLVLAHLPKERSSLPFGSPEDLKILQISFLAVLSGYGTLAHGRQLSGAIGLVAIAVLSSRHLKLSYWKSSLVTSLAFVVQFIVLFLSRPSQPVYGRWLLHPLYTGSDDLIFSESLSWSLAHFGLGDYAAAAGISVRYHWFSLAWSGLLDKLTGVEPFAVTLHLIPAVCLAVIAILTAGIATSVSKSRLAGPSAVLLLFGTASQVEPTRFIHVLNTSNIATFMWILVLLFATLQLSQDSLRLPAIVLSLLNVVVLLSKAPFGVVTFLSTMLMLFAKSRFHSQVERIKIGALVAALSALTFVLFLQPHDWEIRNFEFVFNSPMLANDSILYPLPSILIIGSTVCVSMLGYFALKQTSYRLEHQQVTVFLMVMATLGVLRFLLVGGSAELYFFDMTLFAGAILGAIAISSTFRSLSFRDFLALTVLLIVTSTACYVELNYHVVQKVVNLESTDVLLPALMAVLLGLVGRILRYRIELFKRTGFWFLALLGATSVSIPSFIDQITRPESFAGANQVASVETINALTWLRKNSPPRAVVATNRYLCPPQELCDFDDSRYLVSAIGRRRVLVEGPRFVIGGRPFPQWMNDRIAISIRFSQSPNSDDLLQLRKYGVSWIVIDESFLKNGVLTDSDWTNFGTVRYHKDGIAIIELRA